MSLTQKYYLIQTSLLTLLVGGVGAAAYYHYCPRHYFGGYPIIPLFFGVGGVITIYLVEMCRARSPRHLLQVYLLIRVMRMLLSIIVMGVCCLAMPTEARAFVMTFIANYFIYLIHDSWFFFTFEMNHKKKSI